MSKFYSIVAGAALLAAPAVWGETVDIPTGSNICPMSSLDLSKITYFDDAGKTAVRANQTTLGGPIVMNGVTYSSGVGTHAPSVAIIKVNGATSFSGVIGIDDDADQKENHGIADFKVITHAGTTSTTVKQGTINRGEAPVDISISSLAGVDYIEFNITEGSQKWADHVDFGAAYFTYSGEKPVTVTADEMNNPATPPSTDIVQLPTKGDNDAEIIPLSSLDLSLATCGWGTIKANKSIDGNQLTVNGVKYASGVGTHASSRMVIKLNGATTAFHAIAGIDDEQLSRLGDNNYCNVDYTVTLIGAGGKREEVAKGHVSLNNPAKIDVDGLQAWKYLVLDADAGDKDWGDHFDWANAYLEYMEQNSTRPEMVSVDAIEPKVDVATEWFAQPGVRMMQFVRSTNDEAVITVNGLPSGLEFDSKRSAIVGTVDQEGVYNYIVTTDLDGEQIDTEVTLTVSKNLQMPTPFMGWLSWNVIERDISNKVIETVADAMVNSGLADAGYNYLVIDDCWHASQRGADGTPVENPSKFPKGMKAASDYTHSKGLKFGIYSDAANRTCAGEFGSFGYETQDANQYAKWEVDMLKYDYCGAPADQQTALNRYKAMGDALKATGRDIVLYMCEWGVREPWKWGARTGAPTWRATYDTRDCWNGKNGGIGIVQSIEGMRDIWPYSGPNRFNDADMMCVGINGTGKSSSASHLIDGGKAGMTKDEYRTQFAMWCMWASPLTLSFDLTKPIGDEDYALMTNKDLIAINQDRMGLQAMYLGTKDGVQLFAKDLENGDVAIAAVNMGGTTANYTFDFSQVPALDPEATYVARDLQKQESAGEVKGSMEVAIPRHATAVYRLTNPAGISDIAADEKGDIRVTTAEGAVTIEMPQGQGRTRILVSDVTGRVLATANTTEQQVSLAVNAQRGTYLMISAIRGGKAYSARVVL